MRLAGRLFMTIVAGCALGAAEASAQTAKPLTPWKGLVSVNLGAELAMSPLEQTSTLEAYVEPAPITVVVPGEPGLFFDAGATVRVWKNLGVGGALSLVGTDSLAEVTADIPHPFYFDRPRAIAGDANLWRQELAVHANAAWLVDRSPLAVLVFGGVSFFKVKTDLVTDVEFDEAFPYDTATFVDVEVEQFDQSAVGFNLGADFTWRLARHWGVGGLVRYSRATVPLSIDDDDAGTLTAGGLSLGGGLRVTF